MFALALCIFAVRRRSWSALWVSNDPSPASLATWGGLHQLAALAGLLNVLSGVLLTYASPPNHTPPLIQAVLTNMAPLFAVPFSKIILGDRKRYCAAWPLAAGGVVALGVFVSLLPTFMEGRADEDAELGWVAVFLLSMVPAAAYSVVQVCVDVWYRCVWRCGACVRMSAPPSNDFSLSVQQRFLLDAGLLRPGVPSADVLLGTARLLAYSFAYQPLWLLVLAMPVALWAGETASGGGVVAELYATLACSLVGEGVSCSADLESVWVGDLPVPTLAFAYILSDALYFAGLGEHGPPHQAVWMSKSVPPSRSTPCALLQRSRSEPRVCDIRFAP